MRHCCPKTLKLKFLCKRNWKKESVAITGQCQIKLDLTNSKIILTTWAQVNVKPHYQLRIGKITAKLEKSIQR